ncbi:hypothetical protein [Sphingobacterium lactis]
MSNIVDYGKSGPNVFPLSEFWEWHCLMPKGCAQKTVKEFMVGALTVTCP